MITIDEHVAKFLRNAFREINTYLVTVHNKIMTALKELCCVSNVLLFSRKCYAFTTASFLMCY